MSRVFSHRANPVVFRSQEAQLLSALVEFKGDVRMRMLTKNLTLVLAAALFIPMANARAAPKPDGAPKPAESPSKFLLDNWNDIGRKLTAMAEDFPEDKYDFKPNPAQRSFAEQLLHVAVNVNYFVNNSAKGMKPPTSDVKRADYETKAAVVAFVKKSFADGAELIKSKGDAGMNDLCMDPFANQQERFSDLAWVFIEHSGEHYGQLVVYYRVAGMVPPESRPKK
jgi:uncharacterized damage-inducible protein DinB